MPFVIKEKHTGRYRKAVKHLTFTPDLQRARVFHRKVDAINSLQLLDGRGNGSHTIVLADDNDPFDLRPCPPPQFDPLNNWRQSYDIVEVIQVIELA